MNRIPLSISDEEAKRIKEFAAEEFIKLRESISSSERNEDNSNLRRNSCTKSSIIQAERIDEVNTEVFENLAEPIAYVEGSKGLSNVAAGVKRLKEINVKRQQNVCKYVSSSENWNEEEEKSPTAKERYQNNGRSRCRIVRSTSCSSRNAVMDSSTDSSVYNFINKKSNYYVDSVRRSSPLSAEKVGNQPGRLDFSPIIVDCSKPRPRFSDDLFSTNFSENIQNSPPRIQGTLYRSNSVEILSDSEISVVSCGENGDQEATEFQSIKSNSWESFVAHLVAIQKNDNLFDLFVDDDITIVNNFTGLCKTAQAIFLHLLNSEFTWFRASTLNISDSSQDLKPFIDTLIEKQFFITADARVEEIDSLVELLSVQELRDLCETLGLRIDGNRRIIAESLIKFLKSHGVLTKGKRQDFKNFIKDEILKISGRVIKLNHTYRDLFLMTQLLYALPLTKAIKLDGRIPLITIMNDVCGGKVTYPDYAWEPHPKLFSSKTSIARFQQALLLEANIKGKIKSKDLDEVVNLYENAIIQFQEELRDGHASEQTARLPHYLRTFTRGTVLARAVHHSMECLQVKKMYTKMIYGYEILLRQDLYLVFYKGIWYDRLAHIYQHIMKDTSKTVVFLTEALVDPSLNYIDRVLLSNRASRIVNLKRKRKSDVRMNEELKSMLCILKRVREIAISAGGLEEKTEKERKLSYVYESVEGVGQILSSPEEVIMLHFKRQGYRNGVNAPLGIGSSIFGILFWDVIYNTQVPNVFLCPYQSLPLDLTTGEFYANREKQIMTRLFQMKELWDDQEMDDHIRNTWSREEGKKSVVSWKIFEDSNQFKVMLKCIGRKLLVKICEKMAKDFHLVQNGFPSMILWNQTAKTCKFIQVTEPDSHLTPSQTSWLLHLSTSGGDAFSCFVNAAHSKAKKRKLDAGDDAMAIEESMDLDIL